MNHKKLLELKSIAKRATGVCRVSFPPEDAIRLIDHVDKMKNVGGMMSNICANLSQKSFTITDHDRETMGNLYREWDTIFTEERP